MLKAFLHLLKRPAPIAPAPRPGPFEQYRAAQEEFRAEVGRLQSEGKVIVNVEGGTRFIDTATEDPELRKALLEARLVDHFLLHAGVEESAEDVVCVHIDEYTKVLQEGVEVLKRK